ncbi:MAG: hypothetical protein ACYDBJ_17585 [Aggregatilineales bacterium]
MSSKSENLTPTDVGATLSSTSTSANLYTHLTDSPDRLNAAAASGSYSEYMVELEQALHTFYDPLTVPEVLAIVRLCTAHQVVLTRINAYTSIDLETLVWLGRESEALSHVRLHPDPQGCAGSLLTIYKALNACGRPQSTLLDEALLRAQQAKRIGTLADIATILAATQDARVDGILGEMLAIARSVEDDWARIYALTAIAERLIGTRPQYAIGILDESLAIAHTRQDNWGRALDLRGIATLLAKAGDERAKDVFDEALAAASAITDEEARHSIDGESTSKEERTKALRTTVADRITESQIEVGILLPEEALNIARNLPDGYRRFVYLLKIAMTLAKADDSRADSAFAEVLEMALMFQNKDGRSHPLERVTREFTAVGCIGKALIAARAIQEVSSKIGAWRHIAAALTTSNDAHLKIALEETFAAIQALNSDADKLLATANSSQEDKFASDRKTALLYLACALAKAGDERAAGIFAQALAAPDADWRVKSHMQDVLKAITIGSAAIGRMDIVQKMLDGIIGGGHENRIRIGLLCEIVIALPTSADKLAIEYCNEVLALIGNVSSNHDKAYCLLEVAPALAKVGEAQAVPVLSQALDLARLMYNDDESNLYFRLLMGDIAETMAQIGDERADSVFAEAIAVTQAIKDDIPHNAYLGRIAVSLARTGRIDDAVTLARSVEDEWDRYRALTDILELLAETGQVDAVRRMIPNIEPHDSSSRVWFQTVLVTALARTGQIEQAQAEARILPDDSWTQASRRKEIAMALAKTGRIAEAFETLGVRQLEEYAQTLTHWAPAFEQIAPGLAIDVLREATRIAAWAQPEWLDIYRILATSAPT